MKTILKFLSFIFLFILMAFTAIYASLLLVIYGPSKDAGYVVFPKLCKNNTVKTVLKTILPKDKINEFLKSKDN